MRKELEKYQGEYSDGFVYNQFLRKPLRKKAGFVYSKIDPDTPQIGEDVFLPIWDASDNLHFACASCKTVADILAVRFDPDYSPKLKYALFIYLGCPGCGVTGQRRTFLDTRDGAGLLKRTFSGNKLYFYGSKREPKSVVKMERVGF